MKNKVVHFIKKMNNWKNKDFKNEQQDINDNESNVSTKAEQE